MNHRIITLAAALLAAPVTAAESDELQQIRKELEEARAERAAILEALKRTGGGAPEAQAGGDRWYDRFTLGGYGEIHYNESKDASGDYLDIHRFVLYVGHRFSDWIQLHSELEIEASFVGKDHGGYLGFEQLYFDFQLVPAANVRVGRVLAPLGIINQLHEPTTFNGVERPAYARYLLLNTWSLDGLGLYGELGPTLRYEAYVTNGLDGSRFTELEGMRGGRLVERPGTHAPAYSARIEGAPFTTLRLGAAFVDAGVDNGNLGLKPDLDAGIRARIAAVDARASLGPIDLRLEAAEAAVQKVAALNRFLAEQCAATSACAKPEVVGERMRGQSAELAAHVWPESWRQGKLAGSDAVVFARVDTYDTQAKVPGGAARNKAADRRDLTVGASFFPDPAVVLKLDRQWLDDAGNAPRRELFNAGLGWTF